MKVMLFKCRCLLRASGFVCQSSPWIEYTKTNGCHTLVGIGFTIVVPIFVPILVWSLKAREVPSQLYKKIAPYLERFTGNHTKATGGRSFSTVLAATKFSDKPSRRNKGDVESGTSESLAAYHGDSVTTDGEIVDENGGNEF
jgi:hypothetical protein